MVSNLLKATLIIRGFLITNLAKRGVRGQVHSSYTPPVTSVHIVMSKNLLSEQLSLGSSWFFQDSDQLNLIPVSTALIPATMDTSQMQEQAEVKVC